MRQDPRSLKNGPDSHIRMNLHNRTPRFFFDDQDESSEAVLDKKLMNPLPTTSNFASDILNFPTESTTAYSYARLLPNSLALRLNVLKRSLEILIDRPELMNFIEPSAGDGALSHNGIDAPSTPITNSSTLFNRKSRHKEVKEPGSTEIKIETNASSAALAAFFRTSVKNPSKRTTSLQTPFLMNNSNILEETLQNPQEGFGKRHDEKVYESVRGKLKSMLHMLDDSELLVGGCASKSNDLALNLHNLSLSNVNDEAKEKLLQQKLLYALATPFYESISAYNVSNLNKNISSAALYQLGQRQSSLSSKGAARPPPLKKFNSFDDSQINLHTTSARPFHLLETLKNRNPQAIFTCEAKSPWNLKTANDLSTILFGFNQSRTKSLTFLDLIASNSKEFVQTKLIRRLTNRKATHYNKDILFAGEIVAIHTGAQITWCSLWAKRQQDFILLMFDKVICNAVDLTVSDRPDGWRIEKCNVVTGNLLGQLPTGSLSRLSRSLSEVSNNVTEINDRRYYTLSIEDQNIPCAVLAEPADSPAELVLKIHTLPYIAGIFVLSASSYKILSYNRSISKNLFGHDDLLNQSINTIIPNFTDYLEFASYTKELETFLAEMVTKSTPERFVEHSAKYLLPGLVLPEHFFRKIQARFQAHKLAAPEHQAQVEEDLFLSSNGIYAKHVDGSQLVVDVQLRVSTIDTLVLWITYSNDIRNADIEKKPSQDESLSSASEAEIKRSSSLLSTLSGELKPLAKENATSPISAVDSEVSSAPTSAPDPEENKSTNLVVLLEKQLAAFENGKYDVWKASCHSFPKQVGAARRKKTIDEFVIKKAIGQGTYGKVLLVARADDSRYEIILKCIFKERILVDAWQRDRELGTIPSEIQVMNNLNKDKHPNILRLVDFFEDDEYYYIEIPIHGNPPAVDLFDFIEFRKRFTELEIQYIFRQVASSIKELHDNGMVHRDIKDDNIIIDENSVIKLIDFGAAAYVQNGPFDVFVGTMAYAPPEVLKGERYEGMAQDIWSLGILLYTIAYSENPFYNIDDIMEGELHIPYIISAGCIALIRKILQRDISKRPTIQEICEDPWLDI